MNHDFSDERTLYKVNFGERLNMLRKNAGMSYGVLCYKSGISKTSLGGYIAGKVEPTAYVIYRLALALGVSGDEILGLGGNDD